MDDDTDNPIGAAAGLALAAILGGLVWVVIVLAVRWVLELPPPALLRLGAVVGLFAGTGLVFYSLLQVDLLVRPSPDRHRGRRPVGGAAVPPGPADDASTSRPWPGERDLHAR